MSESPLAARPEDEADAGPQALAEALRAEHAAVYGYEFVGGAADGEGDRERARTTALDHKALRDELHALAVARGFDPPPAKNSYPLPRERDSGSLRAFAVGLEEAAARAYLWLAAAQDTELRVTGARNLQGATLRTLEWGGELDPLPGFDQG
ncbi:ferritin-like domain-containing protein [Nocardiopsis algeriensis]|uniref:DUF4439 domain-containing protein n=1 Tax=Nocardiopsis algeriensis TaxID=1478215 RepID=A0A841IKN7_9ACTN|nr:ferritin-like domain-containing protein [Nocardiopsis algeriensis]MBB6118632.1 hypothetical protein [Nocardiopsis algeriensis]